MAVETSPQERVLRGCASTLLALALMGCARQEQAPSPERTLPEVGLPWGKVYEFRLSDGTPCAAYEGYKAGGITCGWNHTSGVEK